MIIIGQVLVAEPVIERRFLCQTQLCKGACCVEGDAGAPLDAEEIDIISDQLGAIQPFMSEAGRRLLSEEGFHTKDDEGETGTVCGTDGACVFVNYDERGIAVCSIEKAWQAGKTWFRKPLSCHLYPIRARKYGEYTALNYHSWDICSEACKAGADQNVPVYRFLREALVRKFGPAWYSELEEVAEAWLNRKSETEL